MGPSDEKAEQKASGRGPAYAIAEGNGAGASAGAGVWQDPLCIVRKGESGYIGIAGPGADASGMTRSLPTPAP